MWSLWEIDKVMTLTDWSKTVLLGPMQSDHNTQKADNINLNHIKRFPVCNKNW